MKRRVAFAVTLAAAIAPWLFVLAMTALRSLALGTEFRATLADVTGDLVTLALSQALGLGLVIFVVLHREAPDSYRDALAIRSIPKGTLLVALLAGFALHFLVTETANVIETFVPRPIEAKLRMAALLSPRTLLEGTALVLAVIVVAPIAEELLFRGLVLPRLAQRVGTLEAMLLSAMLFGTAHATGGPHAMVPATLAGLVLAYVARARRSVITSIAVHAGSNAVPLLLPRGLVLVRGLNDVREGPSHISPVIVVTALLVLFTALLYLARDPPSDGGGRG